MPFLSPPLLFSLSHLLANISQESSVLRTERKRSYFSARALRFPVSHDDESRCVDNFPNSEINREYNLNLLVLQKFARASSAFGYDITRFMFKNKLCLKTIYTREKKFGLTVCICYIKCQRY